LGRTGSLAGRQVTDGLCSRSQADGGITAATWLVITPRQALIHGARSRVETVTAGTGHLSAFVSLTDAGNRGLRVRCTRIPAP
jgi:hypothetical protein